jgi:ribosomal protein S18 acetylase RimI-like enzyme
VRPEPHIREAVAADVPAIVEVTNRAYRGQGGWTTEAHLVRGLRASAAEVEEMLTSDGVVLLVAELAEHVEPDQGRDGTPVNRVVGCCYTHVEGAGAEFGLFAVDPRAQAGGIGGRLLEDQARRAQEAGRDHLMIRVLQSRPELVAWYERHGFASTGEVVGFAGDEADLMVADLGMHVMIRQL